MRLRLLSLSFWMTLAILGGAAWLAPAQDAPAQAQRPRLGLIVNIDGVIGPASARLLENALAEARQRDAELVILRIDTPGGLVTSMRAMIRAILASPVPVVGYVAPPGAHAASAGTYLLYACGVAAMAPGTNLGAATPISIGSPPGLPSPLPSEKPDQKESSKKKGEGEGADKKPAKKLAPANARKAKAVNDAVAFIRALAELHGRNADWAERAVREAASLSASEALRLGVIEIIAGNVSELLADLNGRKVIAAGQTFVLKTDNIRLETFHPSTLTRLLGQLADPNIAFILMLIGVYGLIFEFANPGTIGPGIIGAICLVLGLYSLNQLPLDYAGLALLLLGIGFMIAEAFTPSFGILGFGGLIAFILGASFLIDTDVPAYQLSWSVIAGTAIFSGLVLTVLLGYVWRSQRRKVVTGTERMIGEKAEVIDWDGDHGHVWIESERWRARGVAGLRAGQNVRVIAVEGLTLVVEA